MKDFLGSDLNIGDFVCIDVKDASFTVAQVTGSTNKYLKLKFIVAPYDIIYHSNYSYTLQYNKLKLINQKRLKCKCVKIQVNNNIQILYNQNYLDGIVANNPILLQKIVNWLNNGIPL